MLKLLEIRTLYTVAPLLGTAIKKAGTDFFCQRMSIFKTAPEHIEQASICGEKLVSYVKKYRSTWPTKIHAHYFLKFSIPQLLKKVYITINQQCGYAPIFLNNQF